MAALIAYMLMRIATLHAKANIGLHAKANIGLQATARLIQATLLTRRHINDVFRPPAKPQPPPQNQLTSWTSHA